MSLDNDWNEIIITLTIIKEDNNGKLVASSETKGLLAKLNGLEIALTVALFNDIMEKFRLTSEKLQSVDLGFIITRTVYT